MFIVSSQLTGDFFKRIVMYSIEIEMLYLVLTFSLMFHFNTVHLLTIFIEKKRRRRRRNQKYKFFFVRVLANLLITPIEIIKFMLQKIHLNTFNLIVLNVVCKHSIKVGEKKTKMKQPNESIYSEWLFDFIGHGVLTPSLLLDNRPLRKSNTILIHVWLAV